MNLRFLKRLQENDKYGESFNLYQRLTKCLIGTNFNVPEYLKIRRDLVMRRPFFVSLKDYLMGKLSYLLVCLKIEKEEIVLYQKRQKLFDKASKKLLREFDALKLLKQIKKLQIVK